MWIYQLLVLAIVSLSIICFIFVEDKNSFVSNAFGAFVGVGLSIGVDRWIEASKRKKLIKTYLKKSLNLIATITEVIDATTKTGNLRERPARLLSGIPHQSFEDFLSTGLQADLSEELQEKYLEIRKAIVSLHGFLAGMNSSSSTASSDSVNAVLLSKLTELENSISATDKSLKKLIEKEF